MASNKKSDKVIRIAIVISVIFCLAMLFLGYKIGSQKIVYQTEKSSVMYVYDISDISTLDESVYNDRIYLAKDIVITDPNFRIGSEAVPFEGVFDGQGHTVTFAYSEATSQTSLFGYLSPNAVVRNVNFVFDTITVSGTTFGGIARINDGKVENCKLVYNSLVLTDSGMFSPFVTINRGTISSVVISGELKGNVDASKENEIFFGNVCVYNSGTLKSAIVTANYSDIKCTDELNILKGAAKNLGISSVRYNDVENGTTERVAAILPKGQFTTDKTSVVEFTNAQSVFYNEKIFDALDFNNNYWKIEEQDLTLIMTGEG